MLRAIAALILVLTVSIVAAGAQDDDTETTQEPPPFAEFAERAEAAANSAEASAQTAAEATDLAFNLLGIFEAVSVAITIVAAAAGAFGIGRLISAESSLTQARDEVEQEILQIRQQFEKDLKERQDAFDDLSQRLTDIVEHQRREAANATLATALLTFGERQYRAADYLGATHTYQRALRLDENNPVTLYRLGYVYTSQGDLEAAEEHLKRSLEIDDDFAPAQVALGFVYRRMGEKLPDGIDRDRRFNLAEQQMLEGLKKSHKLVDEDGESWWGALGGLYRRRGQIEQAIKAYEHATAITPHSSYPFSNLALLYGGADNIEGMLRMYKRVEKLAQAEVQAEVDNYWGYFDLLTAQLATGHVEKAEDVLPSVLETVPPDAVYAFEVLTDTLNRVAKVLQGYPQSEALTEFVGRIEHYAQRRAENPTKILPVGAPSEDVITTGNVEASNGDAPAPPKIKG